KRMYDGFTFGRVPDIYNPWSVLNFLKFGGRFDTWWTNTSSNRLAGKLVREGSPELKKDFETLLEGGTIRAAIDEQIVFDQLDGSDEAVWSLLLASGYLKIISVEGGEGEEAGEYELALTNGEVRRTLAGLVEGWFRKNAAARGAYGNFLQALMQGDVRYMNLFMNDVAYACFSSFDTGKHPGRTEPERFYHGFVLGLLVDLRGRYIVTSNRESGFGRYDVMLEPRDPAKDPAFIFEFKVHDSYDEKSLEDTVAAALAQIESKGYAQQLIERGIPADRIRRDGFAFEGKTVLIG
ncbi:MAG: ATP-binding protein, partial [Mailhella sp.]|nr:ATP-binding protein [Mailhella sp.]